MIPVTTVAGHLIAQSPPPRGFQIHPGLAALLAVALVIVCIVLWKMMRDD